MSAAEAPRAAGTVSCPRCGAPVPQEQDWCLRCGAAARTRLVRAPSWKLPVAAVTALVLAAVVALALAFVALTDDRPPATGATGATGPAAVVPAPAPAPTVPTAPAPSGPTGATAPKG